MKKVSNTLLVALVLLIFTVALGFLTSSPTRAQKSASPVTVVNNPLPVTGTVNANVTNTSIPVTGAVSATITGTSNVNVTNTVPVAVTGTPNINIASPVALASGSSVSVANSLNNGNPIPLFVRDVDNSARNPVLGTCDLIQVSGPGSFPTCTLNFTTSSGASFTTVPAGNVLVIEFVSGEMDVPTGVIPTNYGIQMTLGTAALFSYTYVQFDMRFFAAESNSVDVWKFSQQTRIYDEPGFTVGLQVARSGDQSLPFSAFATVTGYLVSQ